jgi:hypothetical protein
MRALLTLLVPVAFCASQEQPRIQVDVNLVNVAFTVRDAHGALAAGLTKDDFEYSKTRRRRISHFSPVARMSR